VVDPAATAASMLGGKVAAEEAKGLIKTVIDALNHDLVSFHWERDPKNYRKMKLVSVDVHITTGIVLGAAALALLWEIGNWFAKAFASQGGDAAAVPDILALITLNPVLFVAGNTIPWLANPATNPFIAPLLNPPKGGSGKPQTVAIPSTFGAAFNAMMRDMTVAGPGLAAQLARNLAGTMAPVANPAP